MRHPYSFPRLLSLALLALAPLFALPAAAEPAYGFHPSRDEIMLARLHQDTAVTVTEQLPAFSETAMPVTCLVQCVAKTLTPHHNPDGTSGVGAQLRFAAPYVHDPAARDPLNAIFGKATPYAEFGAYITNPDAYGQFEAGQRYHLTLTPIPGDC